MSGLLWPKLGHSVASEADLGDAVSSALGASWRAHLDDFVMPDHALGWLGDIETRLSRWIPEPVLRTELARSVWYEARRAGLSLSLVLGLIEVESAFRKHAVSSAGAVGYMQIMPFWARVIGDGDVSALFRTQTNLRYGCVILRHYLNVEALEWSMALGRYNGTRGQTEYPNRVMLARHNWRHVHD